jgi:hypothetical protein
MGNEAFEFVEFTRCGLLLENRKPSRPAFVIAMGVSELGKNGSGTRKNGVKAPSHVFCPN